MSLWTQYRAFTGNEPLQDVYGGDFVIVDNDLYDDFEGRGNIGIGQTKKSCQYHWEQFFSLMSPPFELGEFFSWIYATLKRTEVYLASMCV